MRPARTIAPGRFCFRSASPSKTRSQAHWAEAAGSATAATSASCATCPNAAGPDRAADVRRRRVAIHAGGRMGAVNYCITGTVSRTKSTKARSPSHSAATAPSPPTASGRRSRWRRRSSFRCCFTSKTTASAFPCRGDMQTPGGDIARNLASFGNLLVRDGDGTDPAASEKLLREVVAPRARRQGPRARPPHRAAAFEPQRAGQPERLSHRRGDRRGRGARSDARAAQAAGVARADRDRMEGARSRKSRATCAPASRAPVHALLRSPTRSSGSSTRSHLRRATPRRRAACRRPRSPRSADRSRRPRTVRCFALPTPCAARCARNSRAIRSSSCSARTSA